MGRFTAGRAWDKLKLIVCPGQWNKAFSIAVFTTVVVALDTLVILAFVGFLTRWLVVVCLPAIACNFVYFTYLWNTVCR